MFLFHLNELNRLVDEQLHNARLKTKPLEATTVSLPRMAFLRPDYTTITQEVPVHKMNLTVGSTVITMHDCVNVIIKFVLDSANEFTKPRIHLSPIYMNYDPKRPLNEYCVLSFDIAIWEYGNDAASWLDARRGDQFRLGHDIKGSTQFYVDTQPHTLLKTNPFEIIIWTQNILRDVGFLSNSEEPTSVLNYLSRLEEELMDGAKNAANVLQQMRQAAHTHDIVNALWREGNCLKAAQTLSEAVRQKVDLQGVNDEVQHFTLNGDYFKPDQVFAILQGMPVQVEDVDFPVDEPLTEEQIAAGIVIAPTGIGADSDEPNRRVRKTLEAQILSDEPMTEGSRHATVYVTPGHLQGFDTSRDSEVRPVLRNRGSLHEEGQVDGVDGGGSDV